jgi:hypothetical protein
MPLNPSRRVRAAIYVLTAVGTPVVVYLQAKGIIGDLEFVLWSGEVTVASTIAALNIPAPKSDPVP